MDAFSFIVIALATWYVSYVVTKSDGAFGMFKRLRSSFPLGGLTTCIVCLSLWAAMALIVVWNGGEVLRFFVYALALAGLSVMLGSYSGATHQ